MSYRTALISTPRYARNALISRDMDMTHVIVGIGSRVCNYGAVDFPQLIDR